MCSIITLKTDSRRLAEDLPELLDGDGLDARGIDLRAHGFMKSEQAPVVFLNSQNELVLENKFFSLCPSWVKEWPARFETYNARLTRPLTTKHTAPAEPLFASEVGSAPREQFIYDVPSFRDAFNAGQTCLVPVSGAVESCYFGASAGHIVRFCPDGGTVLWLLGLWNDWVDPQTGEIKPTFTLLTDDPDPLIYAHGHDRGVITIDRTRWLEWLGGRMMNGRQRFEFIRSNRTQPHWRVEKERAMKAGWQRRAPSASEVEGIRVWSPAQAV